MSISQKLNPIWRIVKFIEACDGFTLGVYIFTYGAWFYENLSRFSLQESTIMLMTGILFVIYNGLIVLLEIPTGALGDAIGRKKTIAASLAFRILFFLSLMMLPFANSFKVCFAISLLSLVCLSIEHTLFSGSFTAWIVDSVEAHDPDSDPSEILGKSYAYMFYAMIAGGIVGMWSMSQTFLPAAYFMCALLCFSTLIFCLGEMEENENIDHLPLTELSPPAVTKRMVSIISTSLIIYQKSKGLLVLTAVFAASMFLLDVTSYSWPIALKANFGIEKQSVPWIVLTIFLLFASAKGSLFFARFAKQSKKISSQGLSIAKLWRWTLLTCAIAAVPIFVSSIYITITNKFQIWLFAISLLGVRLFYGAFRPAYDALVNKLIPKEHAGERATILSMGSMARSIMNLLLTIPAIGFSAKTISVSWALPALILAVILLGGHVVMRKYQQQSPSTEEISERKAHANT